MRQDSTTVNVTVGGQSYRDKADSTGAVRVRCGLFAPTAINAQDATIDYSGSTVLFTVGSTDINGLMIPEDHVGAYQEINSSATSISVGPDVDLVANRSSVGSAILRRRFLMDFDIPSGRTIGNLRVFTLGILSANTDGWGLHNPNRVTLTGTQSIQVNLGYMESDGTLNQVATDTHSRALTAGGAVNVPIAITDSTTGAMAASGRIYAEFILTVTVDTTTSEGNFVASLINPGLIYSTNGKQVGFIEFDLI